MKNDYQLCKEVMNSEKLRLSFDALAQQTFSLSFEDWYRAGEWADWNQPYTLFDKGKAISNITVNQMKVLYQGRVRHYIQLGGVMTDPAYQGQGLSRLLMEEVKKDWEERCDALFLLANRSVTEFYPRFGFVEEKQYQCVWKREPARGTAVSAGAVRKLDLSQEEDRALLQRCYQKQNPFSAFQIVDNFSLLQFYCRCGMDQAIYYLPGEDALILAEYREEQLLCYDIYYAGEKGMTELLLPLLKDRTREVVFLFTPTEKCGMTEQEYQDEDTHLFLLSGKEDLFRDARLYVPNISHT